MLINTKSLIEIWNQRTCSLMLTRIWRLVTLVCVTWWRMDWVWRRLVGLPTMQPLKWSQPVTMMEGRWMCGVVGWYCMLCYVGSYPSMKSQCPICSIGSRRVSSICPITYHRGPRILSTNSFNLSPSNALNSMKSSNMNGLRLTSQCIWKVYSTRSMLLTESDCHSSRRKLEELLRRRSIRVHWQLRRLMRRSFSSCLR